MIVLTIKKIIYNTDLMNRTFRVSANLYSGQRQYRSVSFAASIAHVQFTVYVIHCVEVHLCKRLGEFIFFSTMAENDNFVIIEFSDGLSIVLSTWLHEDRSICWWPGHLKSQLLINRAIIHRTRPEECTWVEYTVRKIFGTTGMFHNGD